MSGNCRHLTTLLQLLMIAVRRGIVNPPGRRSHHGHFWDRRRAGFEESVSVRRFAEGSCNLKARIRVASIECDVSQYVEIKSIYPDLPICYEMLRFQDFALSFFYPSLTNVFAELGLTQIAPASCPKQ